MNKSAATGKKPLEHFPQFGAQQANRQLTMGMANSDNGITSTRMPHGKERFQMVALDLDGTFLQSDHTIATDQAEFIRSLHERGIKICFATGRAAPSVYEHVKKLNLSEPLSVVCSNGAHGFRMDAKTLKAEDVFFHPVSLSLLNTTLKLAEKYGFAVQYYHEDSIYVNSSEPLYKEITQRYTELTGVKITPVTDNFRELTSKNLLPSKLLVLFDDSRSKEAYKIFTTEFTGDATIVEGGIYPWFLEVLNPKVTKGHGLMNMCQHLSVPLEECIAMGDGPNDLEFLKMAGLGVAMKNACDAAKEVADMTLEWTNDENGVTKGLEQLLEQGLLRLRAED